MPWCRPSDDDAEKLKYMVFLHAKKTKWLRAMNADSWLDAIRKCHRTCPDLCPFCKERKVGCGAHLNGYLNGVKQPKHYKIPCCTHCNVSGFFGQAVQSPKFGLDCICIVSPIAAQQQTLQQCISNIKEESKHTVVALDR